MNASEGSVCVCVCGGGGCGGEVLRHTLTPQQAV